MSSIVMEHVIDFCLHGIPLCLRQSANDPINPYVLACLPVYPLVCLLFYVFVYLIFFLPGCLYHSVLCIPVN